MPSKRKPEPDAPLLIRAQNIATWAHRDQLRKNGELYINHPTRVAARFVGNPILQSIAWLHDVVEDTPTTLEELKKQGIRDEVVKAVALLTKQEREPYLDFILRIGSNPSAVEVKKADIEDNLRDLPRGHQRDKYELALWILNKHFS